MKNHLLLAILLVLPFFSIAQTDPAPQTGALRITWPINRSTFQRNTTDQATFNIAGQHIGEDLYPTFWKVRKLQYKIVKLDTKTGADVSEITNGYEDFNNSDINNDISNKDLRTFLKQMTIPKGSYRLQVRSERGFLVALKPFKGKIFFLVWAMFIWLQASPMQVGILMKAVQRMEETLVLSKTPTIT